MTSGLDRRLSYDHSIKEYVVIPQKSIDDCEECARILKKRGVGREDVESCEKRILQFGESFKKWNQTPRNFHIGDFDQYDKFKNSLYAAAVDCDMAQQVYRSYKEVDEASTSPPSKNKVSEIRLLMDYMGNAWTTMEDTWKEKGDNNWTRWAEAEKKSTS